MKNTSRKPYIYKVTNFETGQYYIGSQCSGKIIGKNYFTSSTNKEFREGFKNYGEEKYKIEIIKELIDPDECVRVENYMIRDHMLLKDGLCLNRAYFCNGEKIFSHVGVHHTEEAKQKMSKAHKGQSPGNKGLPSPKKGIPCSEETKQKISETKKGTHLSEETKQKISKTLKGTQLSEETKQKISITKKGTHHTEEAKQKMSETKKGHLTSEETKRKMSESHKGQPAWNKGMHPSEETRQKLSLSNKNRISISIENTVFDSLKEASKYYNVSIPAISRWVKTKKHNAFYIEK